MGKCGGIPTRTDNLRCRAFSQQTESEMRIIGFSKKWGKLDKKWYEPNLLTFTTFRYPRKDRDWEIEEVVQVVFKPRSKEREVLGIARIIRIEVKDFGEKSHNIQKDTPGSFITFEEATEDGFTTFSGGGDIKGMIEFIRQPGRDPIINKLTLYWIEKEQKGDGIENKINESI